ncbi:MAG TPA: hypothetical protein VGQ06_05410 [Gemmatimonadales bacterium]|jgi:hypothetical protein|nr:hypothetical protein [Gemmatimonadales bacterium]
MNRVLLFLTLTLTACASLQYSHWPYRGPMLMVSNPTTAPLVVLARDGVGRELVTAKIKPHGRQCFRWPFIHAIGYLVAAGSDTLTSQPFEVWSAHGWEWSGQFEPVANPRACR